MRADVIVRWSGSKPSSGLEVYQGGWVPADRSLVDLAVEAGKRVFYCQTGDAFTADDHILAEWLLTDEPEPKEVRRKGHALRYRLHHPEEFTADTLPAASSD